MEGLKQMLLQEQYHLEKLIAKANRALKSAPDGQLRISISNNRPRYYHRLDDRFGTYIPKSEQELPKQLAQKTYDLSVVKKAEKRLTQIKRILADYSDDEIERLYTSLNKERQELVTPIEPIWNQTVKQWYEQAYQGKDFQEQMPVILSENGERVRSKSEKILADYFYRNKILYKYEKPLYLKGYGTVYPDFTFISKKTGKEIYWEHEGMMDKPEYARVAVKKIESYQQNGIYPGEGLILTFETENNVINTKLIENLVEKYLL